MGNEDGVLQQSMYTICNLAKERGQRSHTFMNSSQHLDIPWNGHLGIYKAFKAVYDLISVEKHNS